LLIENIRLTQTLELNSTRLTLVTYKQHAQTA